MIHDGRPSDWCKGKAVFENSKSRPSKTPAQHPSMKGYPPDSIATYTHHTQRLTTATQKHPATLKKNSR